MMLETILPALLEGTSEGVTLGQLQISRVSTQTAHTLRVSRAVGRPSVNDVGMVSRAARLLGYAHIVERWNAKDVELELSRWVQPELL